MRLLMKHFVLSIVKPQGKQVFLKKIPENGKVLDIGCGNSSQGKEYADYSIFHFLLRILLIFQRGGEF